MSYYFFIEGGEYVSYSAPFENYKEALAYRDEVHPDAIVAVRVDADNI